MYPALKILVRVHLNAEIRRELLISKHRRTHHSSLCLAIYPNYMNVNLFLFISFACSVVDCYCILMPSAQLMYEVVQSAVSRGGGLVNADA